MPTDAPSSLDGLRQHAQSLTGRAYVPFSNQPEAVLLVLRDGTWIPGVRIESAAFSLAIPAVLNAFTTLVASGRADDLSAVVLNRPLNDADRQYLQGLPQAPFVPLADDVYARSATPTSADALPPLRALGSPFLDATIEDAEEGVALARQISERAYIPASSFPVGAVLETQDGDLIPGVNVEHEDWMRTLCAERNALGTAFSYDRSDLRALYLSCPLDPHGTPCGACRQLLAELAPDIRIWMDRDSNAPDERSPRELLPGSFRGTALLRNT